MSLYIPFIFNIARVDISLSYLKPEVKKVRSPRGDVIWFLFSSKFEITGARTNFEGCKKVGINPMDQALGLRSSLLPHREDSIPDLETMLALVLNFEYFYIGVCTNSSTKVYANKIKSKD